MVLLSYSKAMNSCTSGAPVVLYTKDVQVKALEELLELLIKNQSATGELSVCDYPGRVSLQVVVSSTIGEEDSRKSKSVNHGCQAATLFHPVGTCSLERTSVVTDTAGEKDVPIHITQLIHRKTCILRMLLNVDLTSL